MTQIVNFGRKPGNYREKLTKSSKKISKSSPKPCPLFLVGELEQISIVVGLEHPARGSIEVLSAAGWCQVRIVARYLGYLERSIILGSSRQVGAFGSIGLWHGRDT